MPLQPPPAGSLRARILAGETLYGTFVSCGGADHGRALRAGRVRLADRRPRARGRHRIRAARPAPRDRRADDRPRPAAIDGAAAHRPGAGPRCGRDHGPAAGDGRGVRGGAVLPALPAGGHPGLALATRGAGLGEVAHAGVAGLNGSIVGVFQVESPLAVENAARARRARRRRRPVRRSGGPVALDGHAGPVRRAGLRRRPPGRVAPRPRPPARRPGSCSAQPPTCRATSSWATASSASGRT